MKKIITMILTLAIAVFGIVTGTLSLGTEVKAADGYYGYNTYVDYYEAYVLSHITSAKKVNVNDIALKNYVGANGECRDLTYYESLTENGWIIPEDCVEVLGSYIGYKADGTKVIIYNQAGMNALYWNYNNEGYDKDGYDVKGYDKDGYDRSGYNKDGYDKDGYDKAGYDRDGYDRNGYDKKGCKKGEKPIAISNKIFGDFAKIIRSEYDSNKDGCLSPRERKSVKKIYMDTPSKKSKFLNIKGLNYFPNVTHLEICCKNSKIDLSKLKSLKYAKIYTGTKKTFTLNAPYAKYIDVSGVSKIEQERTNKSIFYSGIKLDLSSCKGAEVIDTGNCILPKMAKNLKSLKVSGMKRTKLDASGYPNLRELLFYGYKSPLKSVKLTKCRKLTYLYFYACKNISSVDARKCKLKAVDVCGCDKIKSVSKIKANSGAKKSIDKGRWWERTSAYKKRSWDVRNYY